jgi:hypothetical protein
MANEKTNVGTNWQANQGSNSSEQVRWAAKRSADHKSAAQAAAQRLCLPLPRWATWLDWWRMTEPQKGCTVPRS